MARLKSRSGLQLDIRPLTPETWDDFCTLFGPRGACGGCWCMFWRRSRRDFEAGKGAGNRRSMRRIVHSGTVPGLLAYAGTRPVGWVAVAPRDQYSALGRSRILRPVDDHPCWSISCLFVDRAYRNQGVSTALLEAACQHVQIEGGRVVEGYPVEPKTDKAPAAFVWTGLASAFRQAGFAECARRSPTRPIMRREVKAPRKRVTQRVAQ
jgi:GNAT superfamily N-acetyltransferase